MIKYLTFNYKRINTILIDKLYLDLLNSEYSFNIIKSKDKTYALTKEKSFFEITNLEKFIKDAENDIYFKSIIINNNEYLKEDLELFYNYLNKYKNKMLKIYGDKYLFGSIAIRTINNNIITTIRGKEDLNEFTIINKVDYDKHIVYVSGKKATLNAPLLNYLFSKTNAKAIVHINHEYDETLPFLDYSFPGTLRDSIRKINTSFNISNHGLFILFDEKEKTIRSD